MVWQQLRLMCWSEICRVYLLVLWYEWWTIIYEFSYDIGIPIETCQWILWISCQQHHHGKIRIRNKNRLFFLYATTNQKGENEFLIYIYIEWTKRATSYEVKIPRRYHLSDSSSDSSYRKWITLKFRVTIMTVLLHTAMLISSICLGTTLLNGLKMNQLFDIRIDTKKYLNTWLYRCFVMMLDADTQYSIGNTTMKKYQE